MKTIWIVSEGSPGHVSQSVGLVEAMKARVAVKPVQVFGRTTAPGWARSLIRVYMGKEGRALPSWLLPKVAKIEIPDDAPAPDLIVSSGGKTVFAARSWAQNFDVPFVFIGLRKPFPPNWFHTVVTHIAAESQEPNALFVNLIPTPVTPTFIATKGVLERNTWAMIIGGTSRSHRFKKKDWIGIAEAMNTLAHREGVRWLLTTSRRTGVEAEFVLRQKLNPDVLRDAIWWSEQPRRELYQFIARSEVLCVTQDSVTMLTEAICSGKPVVAVYPAGYSAKDASFKEDYFQRLEKERRIARLTTIDLRLFSPKNFRFQSLTHDPLIDPVNLLLQRLNWTS